MSLVIFSHQLSLSYARSLTLSETKWLHSKYEPFEDPAVCQWQHYEKLHVMQFGAGCSCGLTVLLSLCTGPHFETAILLNELMVLFYKNIFHFKMTDYKSTMWIYYTISHLFTYNPNHRRSCLLREKARRVLYAARKFPSKQYYFILKFSYLFRPQPPPTPLFQLRSSVLHNMAHTNHCGSSARGTGHAQNECCHKRQPYWTGKILYKYIIE